MSFQETLSQVVNRHEELEALMADASSMDASEFTKMSKEVDSDLLPETIYGMLLLELPLLTYKTLFSLSHI